jgi:hypothetical protein
MFEDWAYGEFLKCFDNLKAVRRLYKEMSLNYHPDKSEGNK